MAKKLKKIEVYGVQWHGYREDGRIGTHSEGLYLSRNGAERKLRELRSNGDFHSGEVVPKDVIQVGEKIYRIESEYRIPDKFADPSRLEELMYPAANLKLDKKHIVRVYTLPIKVKK